MERISRTGMILVLVYLTALTYAVYQYINCVGFLCPVELDIPALPWIAVPVVAKTFFHSLDLEKIEFSASIFSMAINIFTFYAIGALFEKKHRSTFFIAWATFFAVLCILLLFAYRITN